MLWEPRVRAAREVLLGHSQRMASEQAPWQGAERAIVGQRAVSKLRGAWKAELAQAMKAPLAGGRGSR